MSTPFVIIEDDPIVSFVTKQMIRTKLNVEVSGFSSGEDALGYLLSSKQPPDYILLDSRLTDMDAVEFMNGYMDTCYTKNPNTKVVIFSSWIDEGTEKQLRTFPCVHDILIKPLKEEFLESLLVQEQLDAEKNTGAAA